MTIVVACPQCALPAAPESIARGACVRCGAWLGAAMPAIDISQLAGLDELGGPSAAHASPGGYSGPPGMGDLYVPPSHTGPPGAYAPPPGYGESPPGASAQYGFAAGSGTPPSPFSPPSAFAPPGGFAPASAAGGFAPATGAFRPPPEITDAPIGVERSTRAIRIANAAQVQEHLAAQRPAPAARVPVAMVAKPRAPIGGVVAAVGLIAAVAVAIVVIVQQPSSKPAASVTGGVSIRIVAPTPTEVKIDGHTAGKTPLTLRRPTSAQPIVIAAPGTTKEVIPDHDQVIDLSK